MPLMPLFDQSLPLYVEYSGLSSVPKQHLWLDAADAATLAVDYFFSDWSWYFQGSRDYVVVPHDSAFLFSNYDFVIETWCYFTSTNTIKTIFSKRTTGGAGGECNILIRASSQFELYISTNGSSWSINAPTVASVDVNTWQHIALSREGNDIKFFKNGILQYTTSITGSIFDDGGDVWIGADGGNATTDLTGYLSNFHISVGSTPYVTDPFTPTVPLITNAFTWVFLFTENNILEDHSLNNPAALITQVGSLTAVDPSIGVFNAWKDKSPNQLSAIQITVNAKPTYVLQEVNGLNAVLFGTDKYLTLSDTIQLSSTWSHFFVYRRPNTGTYSISIGEDGGTGNAFLHWNNNSIYSGDRFTNSQVLSVGTNIGAVSKNASLYVSNNSRIPFQSNWGPSQPATHLGKYSSVEHNDVMCEILHVDFFAPDYELNLISRDLIDKWKTPHVAPLNKTAPRIWVLNTTTLTSDVGEWVYEPNSWSSQWMTSDDGLNYTPVSPVVTITNRGVGFSYQPTTADYGKYIINSVSATNIIGMGV